jgi:hypothetical protein
MSGGERSVSKLLGRLRFDQERLLATLATDPIHLPASFRVRAASEYLLVLGAALACRRSPDQHLEEIRELAARVTFELSLAATPEALPVVSSLEHLRRLQAAGLGELLAGENDAFDRPPEHHLGLAFRHLARVLASLASGPDRPRLGLKAADAANRVLLVARTAEGPTTSDPETR